MSNVNENRRIEEWKIGRLEGWKGGRIVLIQNYFSHFLHGFYIFFQVLHPFRLKIVSCIIVNRTKAEVNDGKRRC